MAASVEKSARRVTVEPGVQACHSRTCAGAEGRKCNCKPTYQAWARDSRSGKRIYHRCASRPEARAWRQDALVGLRKGTVRAPTRTTLAQAAEAWLAGARDGSIRNRSGDRYKPSAIRGYERSLRLRIIPELGHLRVSAVRRRDVQNFADRLYADGLDPSTIKNTLNPLQAIYRRALSRDEVAINPTTGLELPAVRGTRERIASPAEAAELLAALPDDDRALWATAFYAGLRRGELRALKWSDVNLKGRMIRVERTLDDGERARPGETIAPKTKAGRRRVPVARVLHGELAAHKLRTGRDGEGLVFGRTAATPFVPSTVRRRALAAWESKDAGEDEGAGLEREGLEPIGLHEARHTLASTMIAAGADLKTISTCMGHSSITITIDRYGHLLPGSEEAAAAKLDAYLEAAVSSK